MQNIIPDERYSVADEAILGAFFKLVKEKKPDRHTKEEVSYVITCAIGSTIGVLHKWSRDNFNLAPEVIADILSEIFLSGMLPLLS